jgi:hypothetical protein
MHCPFFIIEVFCVVGVSVIHYEKIRKERAEYPLLPDF